MNRYMPPRDRPLVIWELLDRIAALRATGENQAEVGRLAAEFRRMRAEL